VGHARRQRLRGAHQRQFGDVRAPEVHEAGRPERGRQRAVHVGLPAAVPEEGHPLVVRLAGDLRAVALEQEGHAAEGAVGQWPAGFVTGLLEAAQDDGVDRAVLSLDGRDRRVDGSRGWTSPRRDSSARPVASVSSCSIVNLPSPAATGRHLLLSAVDAHLPSRGWAMAALHRPRRLSPATPAGRHGQGGRAELAAAVTDAGGLGMIGIGACPAPRSPSARPHRR
jgi:hypothetical protein